MLEKFAYVTYIAGNEKKRFIKNQEKNSILGKFPIFFLTPPVHYGTIIIENYGA